MANPVVHTQGDQPDPVTPDNPLVGLETQVLQVWLQASPALERAYQHPPNRPVLENAVRAAVEQARVAELKYRAEGSTLEQAQELTRPAMWTPPTRLKIRTPSPTRTPAAKRPRWFTVGEAAELTEGGWTAQTRRQPRGPAAAQTPAEGRPPGVRRGAGRARALHRLGPHRARRRWSIVRGLDYASAIHARSRPAKNSTRSSRKTRCVKALGVHRQRALLVRRAPARDVATGRSTSA
jgi:hypothetical protein